MIISPKPKINSKHHGIAYLRILSPLCGWGLGATSAPRTTATMSPWCSNVGAYHWWVALLTKGWDDEPKMLLIDDSRAAAARCGICILHGVIGSGGRRRNRILGIVFYGCKRKEVVRSGLLAQLDRSRRRSRAKLWLESQAVGEPRSVRIWPQN